MIVTVLKVPENTTSVASPRPPHYLNWTRQLPPGSIHPEMDWLWFIQPGFQNCYWLAPVYHKLLQSLIASTNTHVSFLSFCGSALQVQLRWVPLAEDLSWSCSQGVSWGCNFVSELGSGWEERRVGRSSPQVTHMVPGCFPVSPHSVPAALPSLEITGGAASASLLITWSFWWLVSSEAERLRGSSLSHHISINLGVILPWATKDTPVIGKLQRF